MDVVNCNSCGHRIPLVALQGHNCPQCGADVREHRPDPEPPPFVAPPNQAAAGTGYTSSAVKAAPEPRTVYYDPEHGIGPAGSTPRPWLQLSPRMVRWSIYLTLHVVLPLIAMLAWFVFAGVASANDLDRSEPLLSFCSTCGCCCLPMLWMLVGIYPCWWISWRAPALFISTLVCPRCGYETDAVSVWGSGRFIDHRERHIYLYRNPIDGSRIGYHSCPQCGSTIIL